MTYEGEDRRSVCSNHGPMCQTIGEIRGSITSLDLKIDTLLERLDKVSKRQAEEEYVERWKLQMLKRGGILASLVAAIATSVFYLLRWVGGK